MSKQIQHNVLFVYFSCHNFDAQAQATDYSLLDMFLKINSQIIVHEIILDTWNGLTYDRVTYIALILHFAGLYVKMFSEPLSITKL